MAKSSRLFIVLLFISVSGYSLYPSLEYYFFTDKKIRDLVENKGRFAASSLAGNEEVVLEQPAETDATDVPPALPDDIDIANDLGLDTDEVPVPPAQSDLTNDVAEIEPTTTNPLDDPATKLAYDKAKATRIKAIKPGLDLSGGLSIDVEADFAKLSELTGTPLAEIDAEARQEAIDRIVTKIQNRIDAAGVSEITIRKQPNYRLTIQIPGETSSERVQSLVSTTGRLEFKLVDNEASESYTYDENIDGQNPTHSDPSREVAFFYEPNELGKRERSYPVVLEREVLIDGDNIQNARLDYNQYGEPVVAFELNSIGTSQFSEVTAQNTGRSLAILLDGNVMSAPNINQHIPSGQAQISGGFTLDEARDLALILRSGSLPVPIRIISEDIIAAKLGEELRTRAFQALFTSLIVIILFMLVYYRFSGLIAVTALVLNAILIISFLASFGLALSISGIAGLLLTIGMSIDANVIIFSRIREELKSTKGNIADSIRKGYARAFWTIFDANVTTLIAAFMLFYYGSGFLQGFATTLFVGIIVSMFTSLFVTRLIFDFLLDLGYIRRHSALII
ncbi:preprotein translocase subunit SecD [Spirochaetota bacterium]|nr:preprotein translocase subunit SecD [Spirochaetota bacterium]